ncbi:MAG: pyridoxal-dependent decarboxylase [Planctomycetaceae bacterium]|jgi:L-2,4-diaminobutyrate decarboxylase|nr:pyridoxal-dependent decarboxylase [Planctomycetaceae bacterium]MDG2388340.1 pyridoxal-dependent decarboxylase [Planctomycetaceae bacterium]
MSSITSETDAIEQARKRIASAYDPQLLQSAGREIVDLLVSQLESCQKSAGSVLNWNSPPENIAEATRLLCSGISDVESATPMERIRLLAETMLSRGQNLQDPRYIGHQVPASVPLAGLFDAIGAVTNSVMAVYEMGPWATACENALVEELGKLIGYQAGSFSGFITHGGSLANLTALLTARNVALGKSWKEGLLGTNPQPVIIAHGAAHYCIERSAGILGIGTDRCLKASLDDRGRIDVELLEALIVEVQSKGHPIIAVCASACATPLGAFDPLHEIADLCEKYDLWMHVDAAHGGAACFSDRYRDLISGLERADSMICDAHKMMFVPALCAFVFYKNREHRFDAFQQNAPYLFDPSAPDIIEYDSGLKTIECTKRAAAFGLWGLWSTFGKELFADLVDVTFSMGQILSEKLRAAPDFQVLHKPECNIVVFRYLPEEIAGRKAEQIGEFQLRVRRKLIESGEFYIVPSSFEGIAALRCTVMNPLTTPRHLDQLMDALRKYGRELL